MEKVLIDVIARCHFDHNITSLCYFIPNHYYSCLNVYGDSSILNSTHAEQSKFLWRWLLRIFHPLFSVSTPTPHFLSLLTTALLASVNKAYASARCNLHLVFPHAHAHKHTHSKRQREAKKGSKPSMDAQYTSKCERSMRVCVCVCGLNYSCWLDHPLKKKKKAGGPNMRCHNLQQERRKETELKNGPVSVRCSIYSTAADVDTVCVCERGKKDRRRRKKKLGLCLFNCTDREEGILFLMFFFLHLCIMVRGTVGHSYY